MNSHNRGKHVNFAVIDLLAGGKVHGPRGPNSYFYMLPRTYRILGLQVALSVKYAQVSWTYSALQDAAST